MAHGALQSLDEASIRTLLEELSNEARDFRFEVAPNPCVGAAVLAGTRVVARGYHRVWGEGHAEVNALAAAALTGTPQTDLDTIVVTLEPCSTSGKTPACVDAILAAGLSTVIVGALDPDPRHRGQGLELLQKAGLDVVLLEGASRLQDVAPHFLRWNAKGRVRRPRPWVIAKWAQTLTGQLSPPEDVGEGRWISGPEALLEVQVLRTRVDAVLTGVGTILADNPRFSVRPASRTARPPLRIVIDPSLRTPPEAKLFHQEDDELGGEVHLLCAVGSVAPSHVRALEEVGAKIHDIREAQKRRLDLREIQTWLWEQGIQRVLLETGPTLLKSYLESGFVDQLRVITGDVRGGRGESLGMWLSQAKLFERRHGESGQDAVLEGFLECVE